MVFPRFALRTRDVRARVHVAAVARSSLQDGIERQLTPPTPPPRRNPPPSNAPSTGIPHPAQLSSSKSGSGTPSIATCTSTSSTNTSTATTSSSPGSSSNGTRCYYSCPTRGCCVDCAVWSNHGTITTFYLSTSMLSLCLSLSISTTSTICFYFYRLCLCLFRYLLSRVRVISPPVYRFTGKRIGYEEQS